MNSEIENLIKNFLDFPNENLAFNIVRKLRCYNFHNTNILVGKYLSNIYPYNIDIRSETALSAYFAGKYKSVKLLPIQPGAGTISIECNSSGQIHYGFYQLYIKK